MKILEICLFSAGLDGVFVRVKEESMRLSRKNEIMIISSNFTKGSNEIASPEDKMGKVTIKRFPAKKIGGESYMKFTKIDEMKKCIREFNPDVIIAHCYRHSSMNLGLEMAKELKIKCFLVTHAPFATDENRSFTSKNYVRYYDRFIGPKKLRGFNKIIAITHWEMPYLKKLKVDEKKIEYIPNGIPEEFFKIKKINNEDENRILFLGRVSPIKDIETLIRAIPLLVDKDVKVEIVGPAEEEYLARLKILIDKLNLNDRVIFSSPIYDINEKIRKIDSCRVFVLPSKREGMPQSLIEALSRGKIAVASDNLGAKDLITDGKNGFLFQIGNERDLANKIQLALNPGNKMKIEAKKRVEQFRWDKIIKKIEKVVK